MTEEKEKLAMRSVVRKALFRPLAPLRARQKAVEKESQKLMELIAENHRAKDSYQSQAPVASSPIIAINLLVVEALFLLQKRTALARPKHYKSIHMALTVAERLTANDMGDNFRGVVYGPDDVAIIDAMKKFEAAYVEEETGL